MPILTLFQTRFYRQAILKPLKIVQFLSVHVASCRGSREFKDERLECGAPWQLISGCVSCLERKGTLSEFL
jgi:hypothetical protein